MILASNGDVKNDNEGMSSNFDTDPVLRIKNPNL